MKVYIVLEYLPTYDTAEVIKVFSKEDDAKEYVKEYSWEDGIEECIWYKECEVE